MRRVCGPTFLVPTRRAGVLRNGCEGKEMVSLRPNNPKSALSKKGTANPLVAKRHIARLVYRALARKRELSR